MKHLKLIVVMLTLCLGWQTNGHAQEEYCGTESVGLNLLQQKNITTYSTSTTPFLVNIFVHIVRDETGYGAIPSSRVDVVDSILNNDFNPIAIYFNLIGYDYVDDDSYYEYNPLLFNNLISQNAHTNAIDIYILQDYPEGYNGFPPYNGGRANGIIGNAFVIGGVDCNDVLFSMSSGLSHEMGHCLGLYHTFEGQPTKFAPVTCPEFVDGTNCTTCGDLICDTPADPNTEWCTYINTLCQYTGTELDEYDEPYTPSTTNYMGYIPLSCVSEFTDDQEGRVHTSIANSTVLQAVLYTIDTDNDGYADLIDNCPNHSNPNQEDTDNDGSGDACCCKWYRGNMDGDPLDLVDVSDLTYLVSYMFDSPAGPAPSCKIEGNIDNDPLGEIDISDLVYLVDFLFTDGPEPPFCPTPWW